MGRSLCPGLVVQEPPGLMHHSIVQVLLLEVPQGTSSSAIPKAVTGSRVRERKWLNRGKELPSPWQCPSLWSRASLQDCCVQSVSLFAGVYLLTLIH